MSCKLLLMYRRTKKQMDILIWQIPPETSRNVIINKALGKLLNKKKRLLSTDAEIMKHSGKK